MRGRIGNESTLPSSPSRISSREGHVSIRRNMSMVGNTPESSRAAEFFSRIKFSHLFSALLNVFVIVLVVYTISCTETQWFTFSYDTLLPIGDQVHDKSNKTDETFDVGTLKICGSRSGCVDIADVQLANGRIKGVNFWILAQSGKATLSLSIIGLFLSVVKLFFICLRTHPIARAEKIMLFTDLSIILTVFSSLVLAAGPVTFDIVLNNVLRDAYEILPSSSSSSIDTDDGHERSVYIAREPDFAFVTAVIACVAEFTVGICLFLGRFIERDFGGQMYWKTARFLNRRRGQNQKRTLYLNPDDNIMTVETEGLLPPLVNQISKHDREFQPVL